MDIKKISFNLPKTWREVSRLGSDTSVSVRIYHTSPLAHIDRKIFQDQVISETANEMVIRKGIAPASGGPLSEFYEGMKGMIASGFMPSEWNMQKLDKLWKGMTETRYAEHPGEADLSAEITIARCEDEKVAKQMLINYGLMPTKGFDVPIPGMSKNISMTEYLQSDFLKDHIPEKDLEKLKSEIQKVQEQMPSVRKDLAKSGVQYQPGKYLGNEAVIVQSRKIKCYQALRVNNFIITGMLLMMASNLSLGNTSCDSLTKLAPTPRITREKIEGKLFITKEFYPAKSTYAKEGYLHKEEIDKIFSSVISIIKKP
ncbi:MAG: hypothetical protein ABID45_03985 [Patescibacteria group bacterium]